MVALKENSARSAFSIRFTEKSYITVNTDYYITTVTLDGSIRVGSYIVKKLSDIATCI